MTVIGRLERVQDGFAIGWALSPGDPAELDLKFLLDGVEVATGATGGQRADVTVAHGHHTAGFEVALPDSVMADGGLLECFAAGELIGAQQIKPPRRVGQLYAGVVEGVAHGRLGGWAINLEDPSLPVALSVSLGPRPLGAVIASLPRPELQSQFGTAVPAGFEFVLPGWMLAGGPALLRVHVANTRFELGGSPFLVGGGVAEDRERLIRLASQGGLR